MEWYEFISQVGVAFVALKLLFSTLSSLTKHNRRKEWKTSWNLKRQSMRLLL